MTDSWFYDQSKIEYKDKYYRVENDGTLGLIENLYFKEENVIYLYQTNKEAMLKAIENAISKALMYVNN